MKSYIYLILAAMLLLCLVRMPYGYYELVRFVAMVAFGVMAYVYYGRGRHLLAVSFGALALLFQPFAKVALGRTVWNVVDVGVAVGLFLLFLCERRGGGDDDEGDEKR